MSLDQWGEWQPPTPDEAPPKPSSWAPVDLGPIIAGNYQPPTPTLLPRDDGLCLLYPGLTHSLHGESESGKSLVAQAETARLIRHGHKVLYLDFESDPGSIVERLRMFGTTDADLLAGLRYVRPDVDLKRTDAVHDWHELLNQHYALVILDGVTESLTLFGFTTKENDDITTWHRLIPKQIAERTGAAVVLVDHVVKDSQSRGRFAIGGQAKMAALSGAAYTVEVLQPLGRGMRGVLAIRVAKDRPGYIRQRCGAFRHNDRTQQAAQIVLDSTAEPVSYEVTAPNSHADDGHGFRPTALMAKVSREVEDAGNALSGSRIESMIQGKAEHIRTALALLVEEGFLTVTAGPRNAKLHSSAKAYREADDPRSDKYRPPPPDALPTG